MIETLPPAILMPGVVAPGTATPATPTSGPAVAPQPTDFALLMAQSADSAAAPPAPATATAPLTAPVTAPVTVIDIPAATPVPTDVPASTPGETTPALKTAASPAVAFAPQTVAAPKTATATAAAPTVADVAAPREDAGDEASDSKDEGAPADPLLQMMQMLAVPAEGRAALVISSPVAPVQAAVQSHGKGKDERLPQIAIPAEPDQPRTAPKTGQAPSPIAIEAPVVQAPVTTQSPVAALPFPVPERLVPTAPALPMHAMVTVAHAERDPNPAQTLIRDLTAIAAGPTARFDLRAEALGPLAVTITRGEEGNTLRLGVESREVAQHIRSAEPQLADLSSRTGTPFVQVNIDLSQREQRQRGPARLLSRNDARLIATATTPATPGGRFA